MYGLLSPCCSAKIDAAVRRDGHGTCSACGQDVCRKNPQSGRIEMIETKPLRDADPEPPLTLDAVA